MHTSALFTSQSFDVDGLSAEQVRYGLVLRLPFRLRVNGLIRMPQVDRNSEVWIHNRIAVPPGSHLPAVIHSLPDKDRDGYGGLWSQAVVVLNTPVLQEGAVDALKAGDLRSLGLGGNMFRALTVLNELVFGYSEVTGSIFGGAPLRFLTDTEFFETLRVEFGFLAFPEYPITNQDITEILEWRPPREFRSLGGQLTGDLTDLPDSTWADIPKQIEKLREHAYHELAFKAKMAMIDREPLIALVLACAALEGAHAALLRQALSTPLSQHPKGPDGIVENLLREQGIFTLVQLTSYAFMDAAQRPTPEEIDCCLEALTMRNGIVHAKQKKGTYKLRAHTFMELSEAYSAVLTVYRNYLAALA